MKSINVKFIFDDNDFEELNNLAKDLQISVQELIVRFFDEGVAFTWNAMQHEAENKCTRNHS